MASRGISITTVVLRQLVLMLLAASAVVLVTDKFTDADGTNTRFHDIIGYRYVLACATFGFLYSLLQLPLAIYYVVEEKRLMRNGCLPEFDFYGDKLIAFLLATGVGVGLGVSFEFKRFLDLFTKALEANGFGGVEENKTETDRFLNIGILATGLLFLGFVCMAVLSVLSSITKTTTLSSSKGLFG